MTLSLDPPRNSGRNAETGLLMSSLPSSTRIIAIVVVTMTLVRLARSYIVSARTEAASSS